MKVVKKVDNEEEVVTVAENNMLETISFDEFLTVPEVDDIVQIQQTTDGEAKYIIISNSDVVANSSTKSKLVAGLLGIFLGDLGIHNFYLGNTTKGVIQLLIGTLGWIVFMGWISAIWGLVEGILIICSKQGSPWHQDSLGKELID